MERFDIRARAYLKTLGKYYCADTGLRNLLIGNVRGDVDHLIENVVYLELVRRGYRVCAGKLDEKEIDFVATGKDGPTYIQVSATVLEDTTLRRELEPLKGIRDNYPKLLLTLDEIGAGTDHEGIRQENIIAWLQGK